MIAFAYLAALLVALTGMVLLDRRFGLFFWRRPTVAAIVLVAGVLFFLAWDLAGVNLGVFFRGETSFMTGVQVAPEVPLEEVFFLTLLCYLTMNVYSFVEQRLPSRRSSSPAPSRRSSSPEGVSRPPHAEEPS